MISDLWYKNVVIYCLSVDTFLDSNGDGVGDFPGLLRRLDYLQGLGVTCVWLLPFQPSPQRDNGYDVTDYYGVDPRLGTLGDFVEFTQGAHQRGIRVIIDLVVNHTSDQHPWFQAARRDRDSCYRDWYVWADDRPADIDEGIVFPGFQQAVWTHDDLADAWYFHRFHHFQPDLNLSNPRVQAEVLKIMGFWTQLGVSGFRMDAVPFLIAEEGDRGGEPRRNYDLLRRFRELLQWRKGDAIILGEANITPEQSISYFGDDGDRLHMLFNFHLNQQLFLALASRDARPIAKALEETRTKPDTAQWGIFLRNHDELDLGRLTEDERERVFEAFAPEPEHRLYGRGIRRRFAPMLDGDRTRLELAYSLMMTLPGTPVLRYGDEIGMGDDLSLPQRTAARTPMQWSDERLGGFTTHDEALLPVISDERYGYHRVNVACQRREPESFLNWFERVIRMRKEIPDVGRGRYTVIEHDEPAVLILRYDWRDDVVVFVHNLAGEAREVSFGLGNAHAKESLLVDLLGDRHECADPEGSHSFVMNPYGYRWYKVGRL